MRKILMAVIGAVIALFGLFGVQIGLVGNVNEVSIVAALLIIGVWIFSEFKKDWAEFKDGIKQTNQWSDPAFWTAAITSVLLPLLAAFNVVLTDATISIAATILAVVVPILLSIFRKTPPVV
jgi:hypothetical protein